MPKKGSKTWLHPPEALLSGHILYTVKFLGECEVEQAKGTEVVKAAIRKMKFTKHIKRAEGQKTPKVALTISAEAVTVTDIKSKAQLLQYPLHRISYCADDKSDKRMFTFIGNLAGNNSHYCYVFDSEKCAEEITLTIGQAFDLAYKKFLDSSGGDVDFRKQVVFLQKKVNTLQYENETLRQRVKELEHLKDRSDVEEYKKNNQISDLGLVTYNLRESSTDDDDWLEQLTDGQPGQATSNGTVVVGRRLENLGLQPTQTGTSTSPAASQSIQNGRTSSQSSDVTPVLSPPPASTRSHRANWRSQSLDNQATATNGVGHTSTPPASLPSTNPFASSPAEQSVDPFGMAVFSPGPTSNTNSSPNQELMDIQAGFSRGISFGTDDFNLDDLDPLNHKP